MKLQPNCVRNILIYCEEHLIFDDALVWNPLTLLDFQNGLPKYSRGDIAYTLYLLDEAGYIDAHIVEASNSIAELIVFRLTYSGHEFLNTIKSDTVWQKVQSALSSIGSASLPIIQSLGSHFALEHLTHL